ncbi:MAG: glutaredoxin family protein, partial [Actinomycetota bacterium]
TMYSTTWCGYCRRLKRQLEEHGVAYREIDVDEVTHHGERIVAHTGGARTVPTVEVGGRMLVNPSLPEVLAAVDSSAS